MRQLVRFSSRQRVALSSLFILCLPYVTPQDALNKLESYLSGLSADSALEWFKTNWPYMLAALGGCGLLYGALQVGYMPGLAEHAGDLPAAKGRIQGSGRR